MGIQIPGSGATPGGIICTPVLVEQINQVRHGFATGTETTFAILANRAVCPIVSPSGTPVGSRLSGSCPRNGCPFGRLPGRPTTPCGSLVEHPRSCRQQLAAQNADRRHACSPDGQQQQRQRPQEQEQQKCLARCILVFGSSTTVFVRCIT